MNRITQYLPGWVEHDVDELELYFFGTLEQLLALPLLKRFSESHDFYRFSVYKGLTLMAEFHTGSVWHVVGILKNSAEGLPEWKPPEAPGMRGTGVEKSFPSGSVRSDF